MWALNSALSQIVVVGVLAFCGPGMFNALNGLGGAGHESGNLVALANAVLYGFMAVFSFFGGAFFNLFGNKILMVVGSLTYVLYTVAMYVNIDWLAVVGGAILGCGAGWFWTSQGAMMMAYASQMRKGLYIVIFWVIFNIGGMLGGFIMFGINFHSEVAAISPASYFAFGGIMAGGTLAGLVLLVKPARVVRDDKQAVRFEVSNEPMKELRGSILAPFRYPAMITLAIPFFTSNFFYTYQFNVFNLEQFNPRTRGFNSGFYWGSQMLGSWILGRLLDSGRQSPRRRGLAGFVVTSVTMNSAFALGAVVQHVFTAEPNMDFSQNTGDFIFPFLVFILYGFGDAMFQTYCYWLMGAIAGGDTQLCAQFSGYYKCIQSLGACVAWAMSLGISGVVLFYVSWGLCIVSVFPFFIEARRLPADESFELDAFKRADTDALTAHSEDRSMPSTVTIGETDKVEAATPAVARE